MDFKTYLEAKEQKIPANIKKRANDFLHGLGRNYTDSIPISEIRSHLSTLGIHMEDDFILTGKDGRDTFELTFNGEPCDSMLVLSWHKMESGRWETTAYIS